MHKDEHLSGIIKNLPEKPGIYQYFDEEGTIIYVGKAKVLKKRVSSYFNRDNQLDRKTQALVRNIVDIKIIIELLSQNYIFLYVVEAKLKISL